MEARRSAKIVYYVDSMIKLGYPRAVERIYRPFSHWENDGMCPEIGTLIAMYLMVTD